MKGGGPTLWNAIAICEMCKTSGQRGKRHTQDDLEDNPKGQKYFLEHWFKIIRLHRKIRREFIKLARKYYLLSFLRSELIAGENWKGDILVANLEDFGKVGCMKNLFNLEESTRQKY